MSIGTTIQKLRKEKGLTQEELAQAVGVTNQAVSKWETDQSLPDILMMPDLADLFGVSIDYLFGREIETAAQLPVPVPVSNGPELPWEDDDTLHVVLFKGHSLVGRSPVQNVVEIHYDGKVHDLVSSFDVICDEVMGDVSAGGNVQCDVVQGNVTAGGNITCDEVDGNVRAGGNVCCDDVDGDVSAGNYVTCGDVDGNVSAGSYVECDRVEGNISKGVIVKTDNEDDDDDEDFDDHEKEPEDPCEKTVWKITVDSLEKEKALKREIKQQISDSLENARKLFQSSLWSDRNSNDKK